MRILLISQWCYPEPDARIFNMAQILKSMGHEIQILTGFPNYPGGKIYNGYKLTFFKRQWIDGIPINRVWLFPSHDKSFVKRSFNYASFAFTASLLGPFVIKRTNIIYIYHPPATAAIPAILLKTLFRCKLIYDIQDLWPDSIRATGMADKKGLLPLLNWFQNLIYRKADRITVISEGIRNTLIERRVPPDKIVVIWNWSIPIQKDAVASSKIDFGNKFTILFAGNHGPAQGLKTVLDAAKLLLFRRITDIQFVLLGSGSMKEELVGYAQKNNLQNVIFMDRISSDKVRLFLDAADVLLIHLINKPLFKITIPSKTQSYLMVGKPILAGVDGDTKAIIQDADAGLVFKPENVEDLVTRVMEFKNLPSERLKTMGINGKAFYESKMHIMVGVRKFLIIFENMVSK